MRNNVRKTDWEDGRIEDKACYTILVKLVERLAMELTDVQHAVQDLYVAACSSRIRL